MIRKKWMDMAGKVSGWGYLAKRPRISVVVEAEKPRDLD